MNLDVVEIKISNNEVTIVRVPRGKENTFCTGVSETYPLSKDVVLNLSSIDRVSMPLSETIAKLEMENKRYRQALLNLAEHVLINEYREEALKILGMFE